MNTGNEYRHFTGRELTNQESYRLRKGGVAGMERIGTDIRKLVSYGIRTGLVPKEDEIFTINRLLELFGLRSEERRVGKECRL